MTARRATPIEVLQRGDCVRVRHRGVLWSGIWFYAGHGSDAGGEYVIVRRSNAASPRYLATDETQLTRRARARKAS